MVPLTYLFINIFGIFSPVHEHLCAILEWRSLLATEVEALREIKNEIEDYPRDFEIQIRLSESLHEQNRLRRDLDTIKEKGMIAYSFMHIIVINFLS